MAAAVYGGPSVARVMSVTMLIALAACSVGLVAAKGKTAVIATPAPIARSPTEALVTSLQLAVSAAVFNTAAGLSSLPAPSAPCTLASPAGVARNTCSRELERDSVLASWNSTATSLPAALDMVVCRSSAAAGSGFSASCDSPTPLSSTCATLAAGAAALQNASVSNATAVLGQQFVFALDGSGAIVTYPAVPRALRQWMCNPGNASLTPPVLRLDGPSVLAAAVGVKDIIVLWDVSSTTTTADLDAGRTAATEIIATLVAPGDFVGVIPFAAGVEVAAILPGGVLADGATPSEMASLLAAAANYTPSRGLATSRAQLGVALAAAFDVRAASASVGRSAGCKVIFVVIGGADGWADAIDAENAMLAKRPYINFALLIFAYYRGNTVNASAAAGGQPMNVQLTRLACRSGGLVTFLPPAVPAAASVAAGPALVPFAVADFLLAVSSSPVVWWSAPHASAFGAPEMVVTAMLPVFDAVGNLVALAGAEAFLAHLTLGGNISAAEVRRIAQLSTVCTAVDPTASDGSTSPGVVALRKVYNSTHFAGVPLTAWASSAAAWDNVTTLSPFVAASVRERWTLLSAAAATTVTSRSFTSVNLTAMLGTDFCESAVTPDPPPPASVAALKNLYICLSVVVPIALLFVPFLLQQMRNPQPSLAYQGSIILYLLLIGAANALFWSVTFDDAVQFENLRMVLPKVTSVTARGFKCCELGSCSCSASTASVLNASSALPSCAALLDAGLSGQCANTQMCCSGTCSTCNCDSSVCDTCCTCVTSAVAPVCTAACGTCQEVVSYLNYSVPTNGAWLQQSLHRTCNDADSRCLADALREHPIGSVLSNVWIDPVSPNVLLMGLEVRRPFAVAAAVLAAAAVIPYGIAVYLAYYRVPGEPHVPRRSAAYMGNADDAPPEGPPA